MIQIRKLLYTTNIKQFDAIFSNSNSSLKVYFITVCSKSMYRCKSTTTTTAATTRTSSFLLLPRSSVHNDKNQETIVPNNWQQWPWHIPVKKKFLDQPIYVYLSVHPSIRLSVPVYSQSLKLTFRPVVNTIKVFFSFTGNKNIILWVA